MKKKFIKKSLGVLLILIGLVGIFLPIIPGILFLAIGLSLVGYDLFKKKKRK